MDTGHWDTYTRQGLDLASTVTTIGFSAVKSGTKLGFSITREIASTAVGLTAFAVDHAFFGGSTVISPILGGAVSSMISIAEQFVLAPIFLGEYVTSTSLIAAHSSINVLSVIIPGSSEASFSLASFINLVKREWKAPAFGEYLPDKSFGVTQIAKALVAWVALQGVTQEWQENRWFEHLREIRVEAPRQFDSLRERRGSRVRVTSDVIFPGNRGQIISADIGVAPARSQSVIVRHKGPHEQPALVTKRLESPPRPINAEMKATLRRLSKMVLAGYGGASLLFFGISPMSASSHTRISSTSKPRLSPPTDKHSEEAQLATAINASEAEAAGELPPPDEVEYSWWDILLGKHDREIFERFANPPSEKAHSGTKLKIPATAVVGVEHLMPRFWVLTDHSRAQIVLVLRGTMSLNEIAVDLTCESADFEPASSLSTTATAEGEEDEPVPGQFCFPTKHNHFPSTSSVSHPHYHVHSGMLRMARAMGDVGKPVQLAVHEALYRNPDYELILCGHSLGAGVAALLGLIWADPKTCRTVRSSGLPAGRQVSVYCFAPPCLTDAALSSLASNLIVSFVYSHDVVSRLSLDHVRDIRNTVLWLCNSNDTEKENGYSAVIKRARQWKAGSGSPDDPDWFIAMRKTLEANMQMANTFPPGRVLWAMRDSDLHPSHRLSAQMQNNGGDRLRLFEVLDAEKVFSQVIFARDMLSAHMPHQYDRVLHDLL